MKLIDIIPKRPKKGIKTVGVPAIQETIPKN
jgi:hypothetical protein